MATKTQCNLRTVKSENISTHELEKFETIAANWWDPNGAFKPLHAINPLRLEYIEAHTSLAGKNILDIGCGGGLLSEAMAKHQANVTAIDMGKNAIEVAKLHLHISQLKIDYLIKSSEQLAQEKPEQYDVVTCMELLEHVVSPVELVADCAALVKPGGDVFFSTINRNPASYALAIIAAEYILGLLPRGTHDYQKLIKPSELAKATRQNGLEICDISGIRYNPLTDSTYLTRSPSVNYIVHCRKS